MERVDLKKFGLKIRKRREFLRSTQENLANRVEVSRSQIAKIETGSYIPSVFLLSKIFHELGMQEHKILMSIFK